MASSGGSDRLDATEVPSPPLALISSRVKSAGALETCANFETATVRYAYETTSPSRLLRAVGERLRGRKALSVALVVHGSPGCFKLCSQKTVTCASFREDEELRKFFETLVSSYLHSHSQYARIDILNCPVAQNQEGEQLISDMESLLGVPVFAYSDIQGAQITEAGSTETGRYSRIGTLYFDTEKLKDWSATAHQTMALFERIRTVGKGAYGAAVLYRKKDDGSHVILKEINLMDLTKTERYSAMNEAQILSRLDHPNIISYYDNFEEDGVLMIEMEYADGGTLAQFLQKQMGQNKTLTEKDVVTMFSQMVDALKYLHDHNILHRDLKTANVFLTKEGIVKLGDFGISKILSATCPEANTVLGTPYYISPEICEGKHYDAKSDIWALGCILYEMVCLQKTFEGTNLPVLVHKIVEVSFAPVKGDYSDYLKQLITEMLSKNPEDRPSAKEIFTTSLPLLASQFASDDYDDSEDKDETEKTHTKSLLYYLDGVSLLLHHIPATFQMRLDHIAVGYGHALALADEGMVFSWGVGSRGQLGHGDREMKRSPLIIESVKGKRIVR
ncbi:Serine/threonine-protein kinase Nek8 [Geodia barretti]|nr:Serine/threonine-protein kinase Nek8 [Geodia barretti]